ncbi:MAG: hypothetical protein AB3N22_07550 [Ruegeria sp.]
MTRIRLRIDHVTSDGPVPSQAELEAALHRELSRHVASGGVQALGQSSQRPTVQADLPRGGSMARRIAAATVGTVKK